MDSNTSNGNIITVLLYYYCMIACLLYYCCIRDCIIACFSMFKTKQKPPIMFACIFSCILSYMCFHVYYHTWDKFTYCKRAFNMGKHFKWWYPPQTVIKLISKGSHHQGLFLFQTCIVCFIVIPPQLFESEPAMFHSLSIIFQIRDKEELCAKFPRNHLTSCSSY